MLRCAALALLCVALAVAEHDKRAEMSPVPFVMGSRYGRSPERVMTPRNDRFFMGSRYGKRSPVVPIEEATRLVPGRGEPALDRGEPALGRGGPASVSCAPGAAPCRRLLCEYTGVLGLFKCVRPHNQLQFARRSADDTGPSAE